MSVVFEIPTSPTPQQFTVTLGGVTYVMTLKWCDPNASWLLDIADSNANPLILGIPLVTGADLLAQYAYVGIPGQLIVQSDNNVNLVPSFVTLGVTGHLYFRPNIAPPIVST